jgi:hypothetical protein
VRLYLQILLEWGGKIESISFGIHGSCVTRDMFAILGIEEKISHYQARSSLCTKGPERNFFDLSWVESLSSAFQRRMVKWDLTRPILPYNEFDFLIIDLIDERFDVLFQGDELITNSKQFKDAGGHKAMDVKVAFSANSDERFDAFRRGCEYLATEANQNEMPIIFHDARWASEFLDTNGVRIPFQNQGAVIGTNRRLDRMSSIVTEVLKPHIILKPKPELLIGDSNHRWGAASFHYIPEYYRDIWRKLGDAVAKLRTK